MKGRAELIFELENPSQLLEALSMELSDDLHRGVVTLDCDQTSLRLSVEGEDVASLRAALNTWIRLVKIGWEMVNV
ncbi:MAG: hypothetical protein GKC10_04090 [Methanosarcinales archaeon]|nr:hypothetical protein [Methanosarcinales archaeon]